MLDNATKQRINTARDILVGKVPDPKSQVEQITIALIYKFMDDMDMEAEELGGLRKFFTGDYEQFAWHKLFDPSVGGERRLNLYSEALLKLSLNPNLPQLFRDIFKNAYLPYRDPETLTSFLKTINEFSYDHSERLGDAFEFLLSVLGSQGDAGQFRTPRHLIDFMAAIVDPGKDETILDPACGTAGFLIASYKRIVKKNSSNYDPGKDPHAFELHGISLDELGAANGKKYKGDKLSPDERKRLAENFKGYDISPDMVRLSLVNLYLHGFTDPHIYEYDTLTSEDRWNEYYDVILANPPFMSPKGGIRPHKRFTISSNRSEVLFVDYIAEHLTPNGRAAVIVPEGIIFQSGTAYKSLRKMLVDENYLVGVISLPAGVFNPYSGVKTSILWIDKTLAKKTNKLLFVKIENDGFDLGAQRRPLKTSDLPDAFRLIEAYKYSLQTGEAFETEHLPNVTVVEKEKVAANGEYGLSGERYRDVDSFVQSKFVMVKLGDLSEIVRGSSPRPQGDPQFYGGNIPRLMIADITRDGKYVEPKIDFLTEEGAKKSRPMKAGDVVVACSGNVGLPGILKVDACIHDGFIGFRNLSPKVHPEYFYHSLFYLKSFSDTQSIGAIFRNLTTGQVSEFQIPLPPLSVQEEIVSDIEGYQRIIDGARQVVESYIPRIEIDAEWEMVELGEVCEFKNGLNYTKESKGVKIKMLGVRHFQNHVIAPIDELDEIQIDSDLDDSYLLKNGDILFVRSNGNQDLVGRTILIPDIKEKISFSGFTIRCRLSEGLNPTFYAYLFKSDFHREMLKNVGRGANIRNLSQGILKAIQIPIPDLPTQQRIVAFIERERAIVAGNKELIGIFEEKIRRRVARVWGEE